MSQRNKNYYVHNKQDIKALYNFLQEVVHTSSAIVVNAIAAVPLISDSNISIIGSLLADIASGCAKGHLTFAVPLMSNSNIP